MFPNYQNIIQKNIEEHIGKMDIKTPKGQQTLIKEREIKHILEQKGLTVVETDKNEPAIVDYILTKNGDLVGIAECKCRNLSKEDLIRFGTWLVTYEKLKKAAILSKFLCTPFYGIVYCTKDSSLAIFKITDKTGNFLLKFKVEKTETQRTVNGGVAYRENAFLPVERCNWVK